MKYITKIKLIKDTNSFEIYIIKLYNNNELITKET